jgi:hypothetical protein
VLVLVGATIVGSMATVWHGVVNPPRPGHLREWRYDDQDLRYRQGEEMGRFLLGSTVVMLFPRGVMKFNAEWAPQLQSASARRWAPQRFRLPSSRRAADGRLGSPDRRRQGGPAHLGSLLGREVAHPVATSHCKLTFTFSLLSIHTDFIE